MTKQYKIVNGGSALRFMVSQFGTLGDRRDTFYFLVDHESRKEGVDVTIIGIQRKDGSGQSFMFTGLCHDGPPVHGYFNTQTRKGWLRYEAGNDLIDVPAHEEPFEVNNPPDTWDIIQCLVDDDQDPRKRITLLVGARTGHVSQPKPIQVAIEGAQIGSAYERQVKWVGIRRDGLRVHGLFSAIVHGSWMRYGAGKNLC